MKIIMQNAIEFKHANEKAAAVLEKAHRKGLNPYGSLYSALIRAYIKNEQLERKLG